MKQSSIVADYLRFLKARKKYWMIPIVLVLILIGDVGRRARRLRSLALHIRYFLKRQRGELEARALFLVHRAHVGDDPPG
ncbi:MAG TPA: hypothetical protein DC060_19305 [Gemmatimonadetes bacterium]|nr:hypothetical protein [Gemmatimonadota bacterium]